MCHQSPKKSNLYQKKKFTHILQQNVIQTFIAVVVNIFCYVKVCLKFDMGYARRCVEKFLLEFVCFKVVNMAAILNS